MSFFWLISLSFYVSLSWKDWPRCSITKVSWLIVAVLSHLYYFRCENADVLCGQDFHSLVLGSFFFFWQVVGSAILFIALETGFWKFPHLLICIFETLAFGSSFYSSSILCFSASCRKWQSCLGTTIKCQSFFFQGFKCLVLKCETNRSMNEWIIPG